MTRLSGRGMDGVSVFVDTCPKMNEMEFREPVNLIYEDKRRPQFASAAGFKKTKM